METQPATVLNYLKYNKEKCYKFFTKLDKLKKTHREK